MAIQPQQPQQQRRGDSGGGTACTRRSAPLIYSILFCPSLFFLFIPTHTHTHIDTLYIEAKTKNKAGVFFSPSLPPYSFSLLTSTSSLILLYLIIFFPSPRPIFFISLFLPATSFLSNIPLSFPPPNFLPYLHLSFPVSSFCSLLIFLKPFSSLPPHFISLPLSSFPHPFLSFLTSSLCFLSPPPLPTHFLHVSSSLSLSLISSYPFLTSRFLPYLLIFSCLLFFLYLLHFFPIFCIPVASFSSHLLSSFLPASLFISLHIFSFPYLFLPCLSTSSFHYVLILHSSSSSLPPSLLVSFPLLSSPVFTSCCLHQNVCF